MRGKVWRLLTHAYSQVCPRQQQIDRFCKIPLMTTIDSYWIILFTCVYIHIYTSVYNYVNDVRSSLIGSTMVFAVRKWACTSPLYNPANITTRMLFSLAQPRSYYGNVVCSRVWTIVTEASDCCEWVTRLNFILFSFDNQFSSIFRLECFFLSSIFVTSTM